MLHAVYRKSCRPTSSSTMVNIGWLALDHSTSPLAPRRPTIGALWHDGGAFVYRTRRGTGLMSADAPARKIADGR
jgi:hypothetical protein